MPQHSIRESFRAWSLAVLVATTLVSSSLPLYPGTPAIAALTLGDRRELLLDSYLIDNSKQVELSMHEPVDRGIALAFDRPWEGLFSGYCTIIQDNGHLRLYYRGKPSSLPDGRGEVTCVANSSDGFNWSKPMLGLFEFAGNRSNNIVLATENLSHNFSPVLDQNPAAAPTQRYKALCGTMRTGLLAFGSEDGLRWHKLSDQPVFGKTQLPGDSGFDSQNLAFWSSAETRYLMFFRVNRGGLRRIGRAESTDFLHWTNSVLMEYRGPVNVNLPLEHLYINQTHPYFRAPHIYVALAARFMPGRQVISPEEAKAINVHPSYFRDTSDAVLLTSRGGNTYDRTFMSSFIRPGIGAQNWVSRTTYPALNTVQTGPAEMSVFVNQDYAQPTAHIRRYSLRLDGFASIRAPFAGGEFTTKPLTFEGARLLLNFSTSAAGGIRVEIQDPEGIPLRGFSLADCVETIGNEIERAVRWKNGPHLGSVSGKPVRLRFAMKDADLYALRFAN